MSTCISGGGRRVSQRGKRSRRLRRRRQSQSTPKSLVKSSLAILCGPVMLRSQLHLSLFSLMKSLFRCYSVSHVNEHLVCQLIQRTVGQLIYSGDRFIERERERQEDDSHDSTELAFRNLPALKLASDHRESRE